MFKSKHISLNIQTSSNWVIKSVYYCQHYFSPEKPKVPGEIGQYHDCWWPGSLCQQVISNNGIDFDKCVCLTKSHSSGSAGPVKIHSLLINARMSWVLLHLLEPNHQQTQYLLFMDIFMLLCSLHVIFYKNSYWEFIGFDNMFRSDNAAHACVLCMAYFCDNDI